jgi:hypothetical protein
LKVPPVLLLIWLSVIVEEPALSGMTVTVGTSPQLENVMLAGEAVATEGLLEFTLTTSVVDPVRLQPFLPSPFCVMTRNVVVPLGPPAVSAMLSEAASTVASRLFAMSSATACGAASVIMASTKTEPTSFLSE